MSTADENSDWVRDEASAARIRERTYRHSTQAKYATGEPALLLDYYEYHPHERLRCPNCGWTGQAQAANREDHAELFDVSCPRCDKVLLVVGYPTLAQTREAAAAGNPEAIAELAEIERLRREAPTMGANGDWVGNYLITTVNTIRTGVGLPLIEDLRFEPCDHARWGCLDCALGAATTGSLREGGERGGYLLDLGDPVQAARAAAALGCKHEPGSPSISLPAEIERLVIADAFGLALRDGKGVLTGWIEPSDPDPHLWELHLLPGRAYPPGHEPRAEETPWR